jgi:Sulfotransferase family
VKAQHTFRYWAREALQRALPAGAYESLDRARRWRHYRRARVIFVHVPKAAGSSIASLLYGGRLGHHPARKLMRENAASWAALEKFAVVREPVARFLSAYAFAFSGGTRQGAIRWRPEYERPEFRDVNAFVLEYLVRGDILEKDVVFWPQSHFVRDAGGEPVHALRLFTTDDFGSLERYLAGLGYAAPPRMNRGQAPSGLKLDLEPRARGALEAMYGADLAWFGRLGAGT